MRLSVLTFRKIRDYFRSRKSSFLGDNFVPALLVLITRYCDFYLSHIKIMLIFVKNHKIM